MGKYELLPSEENLLTTIEEDLLYRNVDLGYFYRLLCSYKGFNSIAIDGRWGSGKTFFVRQTQLIINAKNISSSFEEDKRRKILNVFPNNESEQNVGDAMLALYYDAWENDSDEDPVFSIIYEIIGQIQEHYSWGKNTDLLNIVANIIDFFTGKNVADIIKSLKSDNLLDKIQERRDIHDRIKEFFSLISNERANRIVIFIDELDRCRPSFTVNLLERIKHYFCDDRIILVFSIDALELQHTIRRYYGEEFDASKYLDRFFDQRLQLPPANLSKIYDKYGFSNNYRTYELCEKVIKKYSMQLRQIFRYYETVNLSIRKVTDGNNHIDFGIYDGKTKQILIYYFAPIIIGLHIANIEVYDKFITGKAEEVILEFVGENDDWFVKGLLENDESYVTESGKNKVKISDKLSNFYHAVFSANYNHGSDTQIGLYRINGNTKEFIMRVTSMLSTYADYDSLD